ncbi:hypothetical protein, partial [Thiofilum flexile]|uniref:hypothetical protein n=1 Tax=Thiofilum flexile TaxID=125627 RepID=UPI000594DD9B
GIGGVFGILTALGVKALLILYLYSRVQAIALGYLYQGLVFLQMHLHQYQNGAGVLVLFE